MGNGLCIITVVSIRIPIIFSFLCMVLLIFILTACKQSKDIWDITEPSVTPGWLTFKEEANINPETVFKDYGTIFQIAPDNEMVIVSQEKDDLGMVHYRYQQYFKEIPVENAGFIVHARNDRALTANGTLAMNFSPSKSAPAISEDEALKIVKERIPSERYFSEDNLAEELGSADTKPGSPQHHLRGTLIFAQKLNTDSEEWVLAWMFRVYVLPLERSRQLYINASDGSILKELPLLSECIAGSGNTTFLGNKQFFTYQAHHNNRFYLVNDCRRPYQLIGLLWNDEGKAVDTTDDDNNWAGNHRSAVTSFWALNTIYDYFLQVHKRDSYDNKSGKMIIIDVPNLKDKKGNLNPNNALGGGGTIWIGLGNTNGDNDDYNTTDIVGHEFTHSVIEASAKLETDEAKESAALNESFSDIFGQLAERWEEQNQNPDWVVGDDKGCAGVALCRDLKNPKTYGHPDTYKGANWMTTNIDPHANGGVQNRWFYLLTDGGTGTNSENNIQYSINGIGIDKAGKIVYRSLTRYLNSSSNYKDAREGSIRAAEDLYGVDSHEVGQGIKAWCAVGLCPYSQPKEPDRFDKKGGNPNPVSPDNNNSSAGATPLGTSTLHAPTPVGTHSLDWITDANKPKIRVSKLSIFPFDDKDYFRITTPTTQSLGGCFIPSLAFNFTNNVNAKIYNKDTVVKTYTNASYFDTPISGGVPSEFTIVVEPSFPGQILDYDMQISYFLSFDKECGEIEVRPEWELIRECINCDYEILSEFERVILEAPYRTEDKVPIQDYYFYYGGESPMVEIPVRIINGNNLRAELTDEAGNVISVTDNVEKTDEGNVLRLKSEGLRKGVHSLRFSGFGNGTQISVSLPGGG